MQPSAPSDPPTAISVVGLGNVLLGDDAIGPLVIAHLEARYDFPSNVTLADLGTPGLNLQPYLGGLRGLVVVDAIRSSRPAGSVLTFDREHLARHPPPPRVSPHDLGLKESLHLIELEEGRPLPIVLVGVSVAHTKQGSPMSSEVTAAVEPACQAVLSALSSFGIQARPAVLPRPLNAWWSNLPYTH